MRPRLPPQSSVYSAPAARGASKSEKMFFEPKSMICRKKIGHLDFDHILVFVRIPQIGFVACKLLATTRSQAARLLPAPEEAPSTGRGLSGKASSNCRLEDHSRRPTRQIEPIRAPSLAYALAKTWAENCTLVPQRSLFLACGWLRS